MLTFSFYHKPADGTLITLSATRAGDLFFECDKYCIDFEQQNCESCLVDSDLNVRCERGKGKELDEQNIIGLT